MNKRLYDKLERGTQLLKDLEVSQSKEWLEANWDFFIDGECHMWNLFTSHSREVIHFWIGFSGRKLSVKDLKQIQIYFDDLFHLGIKRKDLDLEGINEIIKSLEAEIKQLEEFEGCEVIQRPMGSASMFGSVVELGENGLISCSIQPNSPIKVYHSDGSMKKVDFSVRKEILRKRLEALRKLL